MANSDENVVLNGNAITTILLGGSTAFIIQNTKNDTLRFKVKDSAVEGGQIKPGCSSDFDGDIDLWNPTGKPADSIIVYLLRN